MSTFVKLATEAIGDFKNYVSSSIFEASPDAKAISVKEEGNILYSNREYLKAIEKYTEAISLNPNEAAFHFNRRLNFL